MTYLKSSIIKQVNQLNKLDKFQWEVEWWREPKRSFSKCSNNLTSHPTNKDLLMLISRFHKQWMKVKYNLRFKKVYKSSWIVQWLNWNKIQMHYNLTKMCKIIWCRQIYHFRRIHWIYKAWFKTQFSKPSHRLHKPLQRNNSSQSKQRRQLLWLTHRHQVVKFSRLFKKQYKKKTKNNRLHNRFPMMLMPSL